MRLYIRTSVRIGDLRLETADHVWGLSRGELVLSESLFQAEMIKQGITTVYFYHPPAYFDGPTERINPVELVIDMPQVSTGSAYNTADWWLLVMRDVLRDFTRQTWWAFRPRVRIEDANPRYTPSWMSSGIRSSHRGGSWLRFFKKVADFLTVERGCPACRTSLVYCDQCCGTGTRIHWRWIVPLPLRNFLTPRIGFTPAA